MSSYYLIGGISVTRTENVRKAQTYDVHTCTWDGISNILMPVLLYVYVFFLFLFFGVFFLVQIKKIQVGKDQEKAQSEKDSHSKNRGGKKLN